MTFLANLTAARTQIRAAALAVLDPTPDVAFPSPGRALWPHVGPDEVCGSQLSDWLEPGVFPTFDGVNPARQSLRNPPNSRAIALAVEVVRCAAVGGNEGQPPSIADRTADSDQIDKDLAALWVEIHAKAKDIGGPCKSIVVLNAGISPPGRPEGGMVGVIAHLIIEL